MFDFNNAAPQGDTDLIPAKTYCKVLAMVRTGKGHPDVMVTRSATGFEYLNMEFTITSAPMAKRKLFQNVGIGGTTEGHEKAVEISRTFIRSLLESARGVEPKDESDKARKARSINGWEDLMELEFAIEIGIEKGKDGYADKNKIQKVITPDHKLYKRIMGGETILPGGDNGSKPSPSFAPQAAQMAPASVVPAWAR